MEKIKKTELYVLLCHSAGNEKRQHEKYLIDKYNLWQHIPESEYKQLQKDIKATEKKYAEILRHTIFNK